ncbi:MAG: phosphoglycolate phosphatase [Pseudomonadota bacterium]
MEPTQPVAVVFDLDGTLIDSAPDLRVAGNRLLGARGLPPVDLHTVRQAVGDGVGLLVERLFAAVGAPLSAGEVALRTNEFRDLYLERVCELTRTLPGATITLARLTEAGWRLGLCTNKPAAHTALVLERLDLAPFFASVVAGDTLAVRKPDPAPLRRALEELRTPPNRAVFVGDSAIDVRTARAADVPVVFVEGGYAHDDVEPLAPDARIANLEELPAIVGRWLGPGSEVQR